MITQLQNAAMAAVIGVVTFITAQAPSIVIDSNTHVPLGLIGTVAVPIIGGVWWLSRTLQRMEDRIKTITDDLNSRPCAICDMEPLMKRQLKRETHQPIDDDETKPETFVR